MEILLFTPTPNPTPAGSSDLLPLRAQGYLETRAQGCTLLQGLLQVMRSPSPPTAPSVPSLEVYLVMVYKHHAKLTLGEIYILGGFREGI